MAMGKSRGLIIAAIGVALILSVLIASSLRRRD